MKVWIITILGVIGLTSFLLALGVHPISRLEAASGVPGPSLELGFPWERSTLEPAVNYDIVDGQAKSGPLGMIVYKTPSSRARIRMLKTLENRSEPLLSLGADQQRLAIFTPLPKLDGEKAVEQLRTQAVDAERTAHEKETLVTATQEEHHRLETSAVEETIQAIDSETRKLERDLGAIDFEGTRFEAIRSAEAEAVEIKVTAEIEREAARVQAQSDRLRAAALNQPGGTIYTALRANRKFDVSRLPIAPASPDVIRFFGGMALWRDFFLDDGTPAKPARP